MKTVMKLFGFTAIVAVMGLMAAALSVTGCDNGTTGKTLVSIAVTPPAKTVYTAGENFDATGMVVTATYSDGSKETVSGWTTDFDSSETGEQTVTVTYQGKTATFTVTIKAADPPEGPDNPLIKIEVTTLPTKTQYNIGEDFNPDGMVVTATFENETTAPVTGYEIDDSAYDKTKTGNHTITVSFREQEATFSVSVIDPNKPTVETPTASKEAGTYHEAFTVTLECETEDVEIYFTTNGEEPEDDGELYDGEPIAIDVTTTIKAYAVKDGYNDSGVLSVTYTLQALAPTAEPAASQVLIGDTVELASDTAGADIYYTTDGSNPTANSTKYTVAGVTITGAMTIKAIAVKTGWEHSDVMTAAYTVPQVATPTATPTAGQVLIGSTVELATDTEGADIYYTTNGDAPTASSTKYENPIAITGAMTIKAIAVKTGWEHSEVMTAAYTVPQVALSASDEAGEVDCGTELTLTADPADADIYYTTDDSAPTAGSIKYESPVTITGAMTIKAIAVKSTHLDSETLTAVYTVKHIWGEWEVTTHATATAEGEEKRTCSSCQDTETSPLYYITFNSNSGSEVNPITDVKQGSAINAPTEPTKTTGTATIFDGWYTDSGLTTKADFPYTVTASITLYAKWEFPYKLGDTGPGGGIIFYRSEAGFIMTDDNSRAYYLEAAPADMATNLAWASSGYTTTDITGTATAIGTGRKNTATILASDTNAPAAKACDDYSNGDKDDWFLPSKDELNELYRNRTAAGNLGTDWYWSSSQNVNSNAWYQYFSNGDQSYFNKFLTPSVRAVRAF